MRTDLRRAATVFACVVLGACSGDSGTDGTVPAADVTPVDVIGELAPDMQTVVTVTWRTADPTVGFVEFGEGEAFDRSTAPDAAPATEHQATLVALAPDTEISWRIVSEGEVGTTETTTTGSLQGPPMLTVEGSSDRFMALPVIGDLSSAAVIDGQGRVVWWHTDSRDLSVFRVHVASDGAGIVYSATLDSGLPNESSAFVRVPWDGTAEQVTEVPFLAHDFVELDDGTLVSLAYEWRDDIEGAKLVRVAPDGTVSDLWSAWDCYDPDVNLSIDLEHGWIHANALDYDAERDVFLVGMRNLGTIAQVDRATGACDWGLGGSGGTLSIDGSTFFHQHQFNRTGGGMVVFDNDGAPGNESRVLEYAIDVASGTAEVVRTIRAEPALYSFILGDAHRLPDGDTVIVWSVPGIVDRIGPDDTRSFRIDAPQGVLLGFTELWSDPGRPDLGRPE